MRDVNLIVLVFINGFQRGKYDIARTDVTRGIQSGVAVEGKVSEVYSGPGVELSRDLYYDLRVNALLTIIRQLSADLELYIQVNIDSVPYLDIAGVELHCHYVKIVARTVFDLDF